MAESALFICTATEFEARVLRESLKEDSSVLLVQRGVGPGEAAQAVTLASANERTGATRVCGIGGAYPSSGLRVGDVACAEVEIYADLGAQSPTGFLDMRALGFTGVATSS